MYMYVLCSALYRSSNQGGLGQLLALEPITEKEENSLPIQNQTTPISPPTNTTTQSDMEHSTPEAHPTVKSPTGSLAKKLSNFLSMKSPSGTQKQEVKESTKRRKSLTKAKKGSSTSLDSVPLPTEEAEVAPMKSSWRRKSLTKSKGSSSKLLPDLPNTEQSDSTRVDYDSPEKSKKRKSLKKSKGFSSSLDLEPPRSKDNNSLTSTAKPVHVDEPDFATPPASIQLPDRDLTKFVTTNSFMRSFQAHQPKNEGLNSLLDGSPMPSQNTFTFKKTIKRPSLREFYGNSVNSPNLTEVPSAMITVRRSPRFAGK